MLSSYPISTKSAITNISLDRKIANAYNPAVSLSLEITGIVIRRSNTARNGSVEIRDVHRIWIKERL